MPRGSGGMPPEECINVDFPMILKMHYFEKFKNFDREI